ncbi:hypothetical protein B1F74_16565 [Pseudomonas syringae]|nr:hypothetical protein B1F74_16565 [Pseudomonas syringae]
MTLAVGRRSELVRERYCRRCMFIVHAAPFANTFAPAPCGQTPSPAQVGEPAFERFADGVGQVAVFAGGQAKIHQ